MQSVMKSLITRMGNSVTRTISCAQPVMISYSSSQFSDFGIILTCFMCLFIFGVIFKCEFKFQMIAGYIYSCIHKLHKLVLKKLLLNWLVITTQVSQEHCNQQILGLCNKMNTTQAKHAICYALGFSSQNFDHIGILKYLSAKTQ